MRLVEEHRGRLPALATGLALALLSGCAAFGGGLSDDEREEAQARLASAAEALERGSTARAVELLQGVRQAYPETPPAYRALVEEAYARYRMEAFQHALDLLEAYLSADLEHEDADLRYALQLRAQAAHALWDTGAAGERDLGRAHRAFKYYRQLVKRFPETERAETAVQRMSELRAEVAQEELHRAKERYNEGLYPEAAERAAWVAEQYPGLDVAGEALALQARALERLGRDREAEATRRMLEIKHPGQVEQKG